MVSVRDRRPLDIATGETTAAAVQCSVQSLIKSAMRTFLLPHSTKTTMMRFSVTVEPAAEINVSPKNSLSGPDSTETV